MKNFISYAPILAKLKFSKDFIIYMNSPKESISYILLQIDDKCSEQPINFMSQSLFDVQVNYTLIEKHAYALVKDVENFQHLILSK